MKALKIEFGGPNKVSIDWNATVDGLAAVAQRAGVSLMTQLGSDQFIPTRGTDVSRILFSYGAFDLLGMQHVLNFGSLKARSDMRQYDSTTLLASEQIKTVRSSLIDVQNNIARVGVTVSNQAGKTTTEITEIA